MTIFHPAGALTLAIVLASGLGACSKGPASGATASGNAPSSMMEDANGKHPQDLQVTARLKDALMLDPALKAFEISVVTTKGDARLGGVLDTQLQIDTALKLARATTGVHTVHDELTLRK